MIKTQIKKFIEFSAEKLICVKDVTDPEYMKYNSFSIYMGLLFVATLTATITTVIQHQYSFLPFILGLTIVAFFSGHDVRKRRIPMKQLDLIVISVEILLTIMCPILYMTSGGLHSATTLWFFLVLVLSFIMLEGARKWFFLSLQAFFYIGIIILDVNELISTSGTLSEKEWGLGTIIAITVVPVSVGGYINFQLNEYRRQQQRLAIEIQDVSSKKEQTEELMAQVEEQKKIAENALKTQTEFLSNMNHEIRTPLNAVLGMSDVILRLDDVDQIHKLVLNIKGAATGLSVMLGDILEYSESGENVIKVSLEPYPVEAIFNSIRNMSVPRIEEKGLKFVEKRDKIPQMLKGDVTRLLQILSYIMNNAIKYTEKGSITFSALYDYEKKDLVLSISDTGIGIKKEDLPYIFDGFKRVEASEHKHTDGTGLGLTLAKKIIEKMGGTIVVDSTFGEGSTFIIRIPQVEVNMRESAFKPVEESSSKFELPGKRIMYVDNTQANHLIMDSILLDTGAFVGHEFGPKELLEYKTDRLKEYDMFIFDYDLPSMDAAQLMTHLRAKGIKVPIVCASDGFTAENADSIKDKGFAFFVTKPLKKQEVLEKITSYWYG